MKKYLLLRTEKTHSSSSTAKYSNAKTYQRENVSSPKGFDDKTSTPKSRIIVLRNTFFLTNEKIFVNKFYFGYKNFYSKMFPLESIWRNESFSNRKLTCILSGHLWLIFLYYITSVVSFPELEANIASLFQCWLISCASFFIFFF